MTNEELVFRIQQGERDLLPQLWEGVRGYVAKTARSYMVIYDGLYGVEFDDLIQSGFLAMVAAVESYEPKDAKFTTWLTYHLKTAFAEAANRRTKSQRKNPLHSASSLMEPVPGAEDGEMMLMDTIPAPDAFEEVEAKIYREQLRADLEAVLSTIPAANADVLRLHFFDGVELSEIASERGVSNEAVSARKREGLRNMRQKVNTSQGARLKAYIENGTNYYAGTGLGRFINTQESPIEKAMLIREELAERFSAEALPNEWRTKRCGGWWSKDAYPWRNADMI